MKITSKGQITIPKDIREKMGLLPNTEIEFIQKNNTVFIRKKKSSRRRGQYLINQMQSGQTISMTTDEIMALTRS